MRGVVLCGGKGTRLLPFTKVTNKHLALVYDKPMIYYPIQTLTEAGIKDIMIITGKEHAGDFIELLGDGSNFNANFTYRVQDEAGGIADALSLCEDFANKEKIAVILGDNIFIDNFSGIFNKFEKDDSVRGNPLKAMVFVKQVEDPQRFGIVELDEDLKVVSIEEKPVEPKSNYAQTGLYLYDEMVFRLIKTLKPSDRGELEITDLNNLYLDGKGLEAQIIGGEWFDTGTFNSLARAGLHIKTINK